MMWGGNFGGGQDNSGDDPRFGGRFGDTQYGNQGGRMRMMSSMPGNAVRGALHSDMNTGFGQARGWSTRPPDMQSGYGQGGFAARMPRGAGFDQQNPRFGTQFGGAGGFSGGFDPRSRFQFGGQFGGNRFHGGQQFGMDPRMRFQFGGGQPPPMQPQAQPQAQQQMDMDPYYNRGPQMIAENPYSRVMGNQIA